MFIRLRVSIHAVTFFSALLTILSPSGNFGFYISNLKDLMAYPELQTAFQHFKEFGNTVILLNMFDSCSVRLFVYYFLFLPSPLLLFLKFLFLSTSQSVVSTEVFIQAAPFLGIGPLNMHDPITEDPTTSSPLYVSCSTMCTALENQQVRGEQPFTLHHRLTNSSKFFF